MHTAPSRFVENQVYAAKLPTRLFGLAPHYGHNRRTFFSFGNGLCIGMGVAYKEQGNKQPVDGIQFLAEPLSNATVVFYIGNGELFHASKKIDASLHRFAISPAIHPALIRHVDNSAPASISRKGKPGIYRQLFSILFTGF
jgi:hypothetical protein